MTFTKEQLIAAAHGRIDFANMMLSDNPEPLKERTWSIELELARIALSALLERAEPMFYVSGDAAKRLLQGHTRFAAMTTEPKAGASLPLYIAPPPAPGKEGR